MTYIPEIEEDEEFPKPPIKRRSIKDTVSVCPKCMYPTKYIPAVFGTPQRICTNDDCGWSGTITIEVTREDYEEFMKNRNIELDMEKNGK